MDAPSAVSLSPADGPEDGHAAAPLPPALVVLPGPAARRERTCWRCRPWRPAPAPRALMLKSPVLVAHASLTARRLDIAPPARSRDIHDVLELFAFVRPAKFCAPSAAGLARAMGLAEPRGARRLQADALRDGRRRALLDELAAANPSPTATRPWPSPRPWPARAGPGGRGRWRR